MKGIELVFLSAGAVAGAFVRYKLAESPMILGTLPVNILIINVVGIFIRNLEIWREEDHSRTWPAD
ncbi:MAG: hypothetical protein AB1351_01710 [Thermoproteota archaeon]